LPSNQTPLGALPARFKKQRLLIVGCGDIGLRLSKLALGKVRIFALTSSKNRTQELRAQSVTPLIGNLDQAKTLSRLSALANRVVHLAPPEPMGREDKRTQSLCRVLAKRKPPSQLIYASTSGVYGNCQSERVSETRKVNAQTDRAHRRVSAEGHIRLLGKTLLGSCRSSILRVPGIYALDRVQGTPIERLKRGSPILERASDVYTNHIHADDLALACWIALWRAGNQRVYNTNDDSHMLMGDYMEWAADHFSLQRPARVSLELARQSLSEMQLSFMQESRKLDNTRLKKELRVRLRYPSVKDGLSAKS
jgi:nucleoside-diphosphate-sugar epimerase